MDQNNKNLGASLVKFINYKGVFLLIMGVVLVLFPAATLATLLFVLGVYWLIDGFSTIISSYQARHFQKSWGWGVFTGVLGVIAGAIVLSKPMLSSILTTSFLMWFLGFSALVYGFSGLFMALKMPKSTMKTSAIWGGLFSILFGIILISSPYMSAITIVYTIGIIAIIGGVSILMIASQMKKRMK